MEKQLNKKVELEVKQNGKYKNLTLKNKYKVENGKRELVEQGMSPGEYIVVSKEFDEGKPIKTKFEKTNGEPKFNYLSGVTYNNEQVSFFLKEQEHLFYKAMPIGEDFKLGVIKTSFVNPKNAMETYYDKVVCEKIDENQTFD